MTPLINEIAAGIAPPMRTLTVHDLEKMLDSGVIAEGEPIELIDGVLVLKDRRDPGMPEGDPMPHGPEHAGSLSSLQDAFAPWLPTPNWHLRVQLPVKLSETQSPEPDTALVRGRPRDYYTRHPGPADILAAFEVAGTSLRFDRSTKQRVYAAANIPVYAVINLRDRTIELCRSPDPSAGQYADQTVLRAGEVLRLELPGTGPIEIDVASLFPGDADNASP